MGWLFDDDFWYSHFPRYVVGDIYFSIDIKSRSWSKFLSSHTYKNWGGRMGIYELFGKNDDDNSFFPSSTPARWFTNSREAHSISVSLSPRYTYLELFCRSFYAFDMYTRGTDVHDKMPSMTDPTRLWWNWHVVPRQIAHIINIPSTLKCKTKTQQIEHAHNNFLEMKWHASPCFLLASLFARLHSSPRYEECDNWQMNEGMNDKLDTINFNYVGRTIVTSTCSSLLRGRRRRRRSESSEKKRNTQLTYATI